MSFYERHYHREGMSGTLGSRLSGASVVVWLLAINAGVFVLDSILAGGTRAGATAWLTLAGNFNVDQGLFGLQIWRWISYQFLHANFFHILINMIILFFFGPLMERWWGSRRFLAFYLLCGTSAAVIYTILVLAVPGLIMDQQWLAQMGITPRQVPLVGASGSIFGILVGCAVLYPHQRVMLLIPPIPMSMRTLALILLGIAVLSLLAGTPNAGGEAAHLGGALLGFILVKRARWLDWAERGSFSPAKFRFRIETGRAERQRQKRADEEREVDRILDKVRDQGLHSLTRQEKKILSRATERHRDAG